VILAINQREDPADVRAFVDEFGLTFPILLDTDGAVGAAYELRAYPSTYFIDRAGVVRAYAFGGPLDESYFESQVLQIME
ncbi:MAG: TlpA disulfide reductase family protein, partial [Anaerolineales bacterium]